MNTKVPAVTDCIGRPFRLFMTAGQVSDYTGTRAREGNSPMVFLSTLAATGLF